LEIYHYFEAVRNYKPGFVTVNPYKPLEHFAEGIVTFRIGEKSGETVPFLISDSIYEARLELGTEREYHSIDGAVLRKTPTKHITVSMIESAIKDFIGVWGQAHSPFYRVNPNGYPRRDEVLGIPQNLNSMEYYDLVSISHLLKVQKLPPQIYPYSKPKREVKIHEIKIVDYHNPYVDLRILAANGLNIRQLAFDLGKRLGVGASAVRSKRTKEGPMHLSDERVIKMHELSVEHYLPITARLRSYYRQFLLSMEPLAEQTIH